MRRPATHRNACPPPPKAQRSPGAHSNVRSLVRLPPRGRGCVTPKVPASPPSLSVPTTLSHGTIHRVSIHTHPPTAPAPAWQFDEALPGLSRTGSPPGSDSEPSGSPWKPDKGTGERGPPSTSPAPGWAADAPLALSLARAAAQRCSAGPFVPPASAYLVAAGWVSGELRLHPFSYIAPSAMFLRAAVCHWQTGGGGGRKVGSGGSCCCYSC